MRNLLVGVFALFVFASCGKEFIENEEEKYLMENVEQIRRLNESNNLGLTEHVATGIFWKKITEVANPIYGNSDITLHLAYTLKRLGGEELFNVAAADSNFFNDNNAATVFQGFLIAVNSLGEGEKGIFYLPSTLVFAGNPPSSLSLEPWEVTVLEMEIIKHYDESGLIDLFIERNELPEPEITDLGVRIFRTDIRPESGDLMAGDNVTVDYKGYFLTGEVFDEGEFELTLGAGGAIPGFEDAVSHMRVGEKATVVIPWLQAYGLSGSNSIPPKTTLAFNLEVVSRNN